MGLTDHLPGGHVEGREERGDAVPAVVAGSPLRPPRRHRPDGLGPIERLDLALLVGGEHQGSLGRMDIEPNDVADFLDELRIIGELEGFHPVWLQAEAGPDATHRRMAEAADGSHTPRTPVGGIPGAWSPRCGSPPPPRAHHRPAGAPQRGSSSSPAGPRAMSERAICRRCAPSGGVRGPLADQAPQRSAGWAASYRERQPQLWALRSKAFDKQGTRLSQLLQCRS